MRKRSSQHRNLRPRGFFGRVAHLFRERQIYVRSKGEVQFVTVRPYMLVIGLFILMSGFFWIAFASINVTFKDELIAVKERRLYQARLDHEERIAELRKTIDRLNEKLMLDQDGYLQKVDTLRGDYKKLVDQHERLTEFFRQGWMPVKNPPKTRTGGKQGQALPGSTGKQDLTPERAGKESFNQLSMGQKYAKEFTSKRLALKPLGDVAKEMQTFSGLQVSLLNDVIAMAKAQTSATAKIYTRLGVNPNSVLKAAKPIPADAVGGPFIPANADSVLTRPVAGKMREAVAQLNKSQLLLKQSQQLPLAMPVYNITRFSSRFGLRRDPLRRVAAMHTGIDIKAAYAAKVLSTADGVVIAAGWAGGYGRLVKIRHENGISTRYAHLARILVKKGQHVKAGTPIGLLGNSGRSTGAHLHYETRLHDRAMDPTRFWKARHDFQTLSKKR